MSLLDGKYEVIAQRPLEGGRTHFDATDPDGAPVRIEWFDLPAAQEPAFERYRRLLKRLKREGHAAVYDVIARPGAHYVAWQRPPAGAQPTTERGIEAALALDGYPLEAADIRRPAPRERPLLYGLGFDGGRAPVPTAVEPDARLRPLRGGRTPMGPLTRLSSTGLSWVVAAALALASVGVLMAAFGRYTVDDAVRLPDLLGASAEAAAETLRSLGLGVDLAAIASDEAPGTVVAIDPTAGSELRPGRRVLVTYALPHGQLAPTEVPALVGLAYPDEVEAALKGAGLEVGSAARIEAPAPAGVVLAQAVDAGSTAGTGERIDVLVSLGPRRQETFLPNLVGRDVEEARALAAVAGLGPDRVLEDRVSAANGAPGEVLAQSLAPYEPFALEGAMLRLVVQAGVAAGSRREGMPDMVGMDLEDATRTAVGWQVLVDRIATTSLPEGVVAQDPGPGALAAAGTPLRLTVNAHPVALTAPNVFAIVRAPMLRRVPYAWAIQPGIRASSGEVWATTLDGQRTLVGRVTVRGGEILRGTWLTLDPGPVTFELLVGGVPYGEPLLVP